MLDHGRKQLADIKLQTFTSEQLIRIRQVLARVVRSLPEAERTPAIISCLAHTILKLAGSGETNPESLEGLALAKIRDECPNCKGCAGLRSADKAADSSQLEFKASALLEAFVHAENINLYQKLLAEAASGSERQSMLMKLLAIEKLKKLPARRLPD